MITAITTETLSQDVLTAVAVLAEAGELQAQQSRCNTSHGRNWIVIHSGYTYRIKADMTEIRFDRWAKGNGFGRSRQLSAKTYEPILQAAGFITEIENKTLVIKGRQENA
jgi:hypothetical protein